MSRIDVEQSLLTAYSGGVPFYATAWTSTGTQPLRRRDFVGIVAITDGAGQLDIVSANGRLSAIPLAPGDLFLFRPRDVCRIASSAPDGVGGYSFDLSLPLWTDFAALVGLDSRWLTADRPPQLRFDAGDAELIDRFERAVARFRAERLVRHQFELWLSMIPVLFDRDAEEPRGAPPWLAQSLEAMTLEANLAIGMPRLLELARVSPSHLSRTVRRYFGMTPNAIVLQLRLRHAENLLLTTNDSVGAIAARCGFVSLAHFSRAVKRETTFSPREYRRRNAGPLTVDVSSAGRRDRRTARDPRPDPVPTSPGSPSRPAARSTPRIIRVAHRWD